MINDRVDLTSACIRPDDDGATTSARNPLGDALLADAGFFDRLGRGTAGLEAYVRYLDVLAFASSRSAQLTAAAAQRD